MKIIDTLVTKFVEKILKDMENISDELIVEKTNRPIDDAKNDLINKEAYKKLYAKQALLQILRIF